MEEKKDGKKIQAYRAPRGTVDILPKEQRYWRYVEKTATSIVKRFGYERIDTPLFEDSRLFVRSIGEVTDIVQKEMYTFEDKGGDVVTLRPEGTAPVCRAYLEHGMQTFPQPVRLYYFCPIFRYERPQAGRYRQHHQFGLEALGDGDALVDAEVIEIAWRILSTLGLRDLSLAVNSIGDMRCRPAYIEKLKEYYSGHADEICNECKNRLVRNPMRLLDCKQPQCQSTVAGAPHAVEYLCEACRDHWDSLLSYLEALEIPYKIEHRLVRGFDYYTRTVFEIQPPREGAMSTILGGGRYDGLIQELGGKPTPGIGFGMGMERVILNLKMQEIPVPQDEVMKVVITYVGDGTKQAALALASKLRRDGTSAVLAPASKSLKAQMRYASAVGAAYAVIMGEEEISKGNVVVKEMATGEQQEMALGAVSEFFGVSV